MKTLVIFDSYFGNTEQVARAVGNTLSSQGTEEIVKVSEVSPQQMEGVDLLVVGSPTRAFQPSDGTKAFLKRLANGSLDGIKVAAFDTRIKPEDTGSSFLKFMVNIFGYAAKPIADRLAKKGGQLAGTPEGFYVKASEGPLKDGELERAAAWAVKLANN